jgi:E3 ubiquitin-protein ligase TM129
LDFFIHRRSFVQQVIERELSQEDYFTDFNCFLGFTIENLFANYLGSESILFIQYHINRSCLALLIHSVVPVLYFFIYYLYFDVSFGDSFLQYFWITLSTLSVILPFAVMSLIAHYKKNNWENHPISKILKKYCNSPDQSWEVVAAEINNEFRRNDKLVKRHSAVTKIIATENWIIKTSLYFVHFAHQSDSALIAIKSDSHSISMHDSNDSVQFVNIQVKPTRTGVKDFSIRINSLDFKDLQDRVNRPITVLSSVRFHTSLIDRFIDIFIAEVEMNPKYVSLPVPTTDTCFACMNKPPDVKINKTCIDGTHEANCTNCFCRPMWCVSCLGRWFASRQEASERDTWLRKQASCPMCRSTFCVLDVCLLQQNIQ